MLGYGLALSAYLRPMDMMQTPQAHRYSIYVATRQMNHSAAASNKFRRFSRSVA